MPHIIIEHTTGKQPTDNAALMQSVHTAAMTTGLFGEKAIKVRVKAYDAALIGGVAADFAHITIYLIEGRDDAAKKKLTEVLHQALMVHFKNYDFISVDARDLTKAVYTKTTK